MGDTMSAAFASVRAAKTIVLTTYKRDGTAVATPVSIACTTSFDPIRVRPSPDLSAHAAYR